MDKKNAGKLSFTGTAEAELFTKELHESMQGVLTKNYESRHCEMQGFIASSVDGRYWWDTMWTRDAGTMLRELVLWGYFEEVGKAAECLLNLVKINDEGYYLFPEFFKYGEGGSGSETDGTGSIIIALILLWKRLEDSDTLKSRIYSFLHADSSPLSYFIKTLDKEKLIAGSGEFGGGWQIAGRHYNAVQNQLVYLSLTAAAGMEAEAGDRETGKLYIQYAEKLWNNMMSYLIDSDGSWIWCIGRDTLKPDPKVLNHHTNKGFGGINGVLAMYADILGFEPVSDGWQGLAPSKKTFSKLYNSPVRKQQFDKYGLWTQYEEIWGGMLTGASYGQGYALQCMLLTDKTDMTEKSLSYLINATYEPPYPYHVTRESPYYFYEVYYSPDAAQIALAGKGRVRSRLTTQYFEGTPALDECCGALNVVNVAEPLKAARIIAGIDDTAYDCVKLIPRLPYDWTGYKAENWPVYCGGKLYTMDINYSANRAEKHLRLEVKDGMVLPRVTVKIDGKYYHYEEIAYLEI